MPFDGSNELYVGRDKYYEEPLAAPSAMWTDLYALTMAQTLYFEKRHEQVATFHAFVREMPFKGAYLVTAGQNIIAEWLDKNWKFTERDIYRLSQKTVINPKTGLPEKLFKPEFLKMLEEGKLELSLEMMPEGEIAFPSEPIYKVVGPIWQCLLVEAAILNCINSQSGFATYGSILKTAANNKTVAEFGLRRAQAVGGLSATRGAYVGGVDVTSNCWAETNYGINTIGTMAHAYVMIHETEYDAYYNWAKHNPNLGVFLPDTYEPYEGMRKVLQACKETDTVFQGHRQDSGDLAELNRVGLKEAREAGYDPKKMGLSNDLDAVTIDSLEAQGTETNFYAVGTKLATLWEQPAIGGVYKVGAIYENGLTQEEIRAMKLAVRTGAIDPKDIRDKVRDIMKLSSVSIKMTYPGELDLIRYLKEENGKLYFDGGTIYPTLARDPLVFDDPNDPFSGRLAQDVMSVRRNNHIISKTFNKGTRAYRPLVPYFHEGKLIGKVETVHIARDRSIEHQAMLDVRHKRRLNPHEHVVGVEESLLARQEAMGRRLRNTGNTVKANLV